MGTNIWATVGGVPQNLPLATLLGAPYQLMGMDAAGALVEYKNAFFNNATSQFYVPDGLVGAPSLSFSGELTSGFRRIGAGNVGLSILGSNVVDWNATRTKFSNHIQLSTKLIEEDFGADIAAGAAIELANATGNYLRVTNAAGAQLLASLGGANLPAGTCIEIKWVITGGSVTLVYDVNQLVLPGAANFPIQDKDITRFRKTNDASPFWEMVGFLRGFASTVFTNKGDMLTGLGAGASGILPVGANGTIPVADSTSPNGISWQTAGFTSGDVKQTYKNVADVGWVMMNDGSIGSGASGATTRANADVAAAYAILWANVADAWCPVTGGRGANAAADFAANKPMFLPKVVGRALAISGTAALAQSPGFANVDVATDKILVNDASSYYTGTPVVFTTSAASPPAPLVAGTTYFAILSDATHIKLATTLANAQNNTAIDLTTQGAGVHTFTINFSAKALGQVLGEDAHAQNILELISHNHPTNNVTGIVGAGGTGLAGGGSSATAVTTLVTGGNQAANIVQPVAYLNTMLKL